MPADVLNPRRPSVATTNIKSGNPVYGSNEWKVLGDLANWCNGSGKMLVPWTGVGYTCASGAAGTFHFYVAPSKRAVERVWAITLNGSECSVTVGGAAAVTVYPPPATDYSSRSTFFFREALSAKTSVTADATVVVDPAGTGNTLVREIACYEQTRKRLDLNTDDYGVDVSTLVSRQPISDLDFKSVAGVIDAYDNLDARRSGVFHWTSNVSDAASYLDVTQVAYTDLFPLHPPALGAISTTGDTTTTFTVAAYAKVNAGSGNIKFLSDQAAANVVLAVTGTSYAWVEDSLTIQTEDLSIADGRRGNAWEGIQIQAQKDTATTLSIAALSVIRTGRPI